MESNQFSIRKAHLPEDLNLIESFRYKVYVEELGIRQRNACHKNKTVPDSLDETGHHFIAFEGGKMRGLLRLNFARESNIGEFETLFNMKRVGDAHPQKTSIMSSFLIEKEYRSTNLSLQLIEEGLRLMYRSGVDHLFFCGSELYVDYYHRLGAYRSEEKIQHPDQGPAIVFYCPVTSIERFREVGSPLVRVATEYWEGKYTGLPQAPSRSSSMLELDS